MEDLLLSSFPIDSCSQIGAASARLLSSVGCYVALASPDKEGLEAQKAEYVKDTSEPSKVRLPKR